MLGKMMPLNTAPTSKEKPRNQRPKKTDKATANNSTIHAEIQFEEEHKTQRIIKEQELKNGHIVEELESDHGEGTERRATSKISSSYELSQALIQPYMATG